MMLGEAMNMMFGPEAKEEVTELEAVVQVVE
jgi:hypothetical protein